jgi:hypothetical protein
MLVAMVVTGTVGWGTAARATRSGMPVHPT